MVEAEGTNIVYEKIDVAKILGNPKITFVLGMSVKSTYKTFKSITQIYFCRRTCVRKRHTV